MKRSIYFSRVSFAIFLLFLIASCSKPYYITDNFAQKTKTHQLLAVVPVEMVFTGKPIGQIEEEDVKALEEAESKAFQISLLSQLLQSNQNTNKPIRIDFQSTDKTNALLQKKGISIRDSWEKPAEELAQILGVDAVVKTRVEKTRYLSDLASYGIDLGRKIIGILSGGRSVLMTSGDDVDKTSDIKASCQLVDSKNGIVLWSMSLTDDTDWNNPSSEVIDKINRQLAKSFPYRKKR